MNPIDFPESNIVFTAGGLPNVRDVVGFRGKEGEHDVCVLCYEPTPEERADIAAGAPIWLVVRGETLQPVRLQVESPFVPPDVVPAAAAPDFLHSLKTLMAARGIHGDAEEFAQKLLGKDNHHACGILLCISPHRLSRIYAHKVGVSLKELTDEQHRQAIVDAVVRRASEIEGRIAPPTACVTPHMPMKCKRCASSFFGCDCPDPNHALQYPDVRDVVACRYCHSSHIENGGVALRGVVRRLAKDLYQLDLTDDEVEGIAKAAYQAYCQNPTAHYTQAVSDAIYRCIRRWERNGS